MRIALINGLFPDIGIGGSEVSTFYLASGLKRLGHKVRVFSQNNSEITTLETYKEIEVLRLGSPSGYQPNIYATPQLEQAYKRYGKEKVVSLSDRMGPHILEFNPNIIHTSVIGNVSSLWNLASMNGIPAIHTLRSYSLLCHRRMLIGNSPCLRQCSSCLNKSRQRSRNGSNKVTGVVSISKHVQNVYKSAGWFSNVKNQMVIPNSYDNPDLSFQPQNVKKKYDFGYIGRIHETKGVEELLHSFQRLQETTSNSRLLIAGEGNAQYISRLKSKFESDAIRFVGFINQKDFFTSVKFCVVPSIWYEPFGRVFVESLHYGVPVLGSKRGGGSEVLTRDTGWLFDPSDEVSFLEKMLAAKNISTNRYDEMVQSCIFDANKYSVQKIAETYSNFYFKCIGVTL